MLEIHCGPSIWSLFFANPSHLLFDEMSDVRPLVLSTDLKEPNRKDPPGFIDRLPSSPGSSTAHSPASDLECDLMIKPGLNCDHKASKHTISCPKQTFLEPDLLGGIQHRDSCLGKAQYITLAQNS